MKRGLGILSGVLAILGGVIALVASAKALFLGVIVGVGGVGVALLAVLAGLLLLCSPAVLGVVAIGASLRRSGGSTLGVAAGVAGMVAGPALATGGWAVGERLKPSRAKELPAPPGCVVQASDLGSVNAPCTPTPGDDYGQGSCPPSYTCTPAFSSANQGKSYCQISCAHDCYCPRPARCVNATCQSGRELPR